MEKEYAIFKGSFRFPKTFIAKSKKMALISFSEYVNDNAVKGFQAIKLKNK